MLATPNRFKLDSTKQRRHSRNTATYHGQEKVHIICFQVNKPIRLRGAGIYGPMHQGRNHEVTLKLLRLADTSSDNHQPPQKKTRTSSAWDTVTTTEKLKAQYLGSTTNIHEIEFSEPANIQDNTSYALELVISDTGAGSETVIGYDGQSRLQCEDVVFALSEVTGHPSANRDNTSVETGQFPYIFFDRNIASCQKVVFEMAIPSDSSSFKEKSGSLTLNRFRLNLVGEIVSNQLIVSVRCKPNQPEEGIWRFKTVTELVVLHPRDYHKSIVIQKENTFSQQSKTVKLLKQDIAILRNPREGFLLYEDDVAIQLTVRYVEAFVGSRQDWNLSFDVPWKDSDVIFKVEGIPVHCHKVVLSLASPVFQQMFSGKFEEAKASEIELPDKTLYRFTSFLRFLYPSIEGVACSLTSDIAWDIIELFHEFQVIPLETAAEQKLVEDVSKVNALRYLTLAYKCGFEDLKERALQVATTIDSGCLQRDRYFVELSDEARYLVQEVRLRQLEDSRAGRP